MEELGINYLAVVVSAVAAMALGYVWYGPLFGKQWMALMGSTPESTSMKGSMMQSYGLQAVGSLVTAYVLAHFVIYLNATTPDLALQLGFWTWLGFVAPAMLGMVLWEGKPWKLYAILASYQLVMLEVMALILSLPVWS